jgi:hypothetical protein
VGDLTVAAEAALVRSIDAENAVALLGLADQLGTAGLRRAAFKYVAARPTLLTPDSLAELPDHLRCDVVQCCGSESGSVGSERFWASWIRIH